MSKKIYYWCPFVDKVATVKSVFNSAKSLNKYSKNQFNSTIIDASGEWISHDEELKKNKIDIIYLNKKLQILKKPKVGYIKSRLTYIYIFLSCFFSLKNILTKNQPEFLVIHLITPLPMVLFYLFNFKTKLILRISGYPKMNIIRRFFWKTLASKIYRVTSPTQATLDTLTVNKIFLKSKTFLLRDPVISSEEFIDKKKHPIPLPKNLAKGQYILNVGRLTRQKNHIFLLENFNKLQIKYDDLQLVIVGEGEERLNLEKFIQQKKLSEKVFLLNYTSNLYNLYKNCKSFILSSLWEDPGFVLVEAAYHNNFIISSDCKNGPEEFIRKDGGILYKTNSSSDFLSKFEQFMNKNKKDIYHSKLILKKRTKNFSTFNHFIQFKKILEF